MIQKESARDASPVSAKVFGSLYPVKPIQRDRHLYVSCAVLIAGMLLDVRRLLVRRAIHKDSDMASNAQTC